MFIDTEWAEAATISAMMTYAIAYGGFAQVIAGILEVRMLGVFAQLLQHLSVQMMCWADT